MAVARLKNPVTLNEDDPEMDGMLQQLPPPLSPSQMPEEGVEEPLRQLTRNGLPESPLGASESPIERVRNTPPTTVRRASLGASQATPTQPTAPTPVASQPPNPTVAGQAGQQPSQSSAAVARQPLVLGAGGRPGLGGGELFSGGFGAGLDRRTNPKDIMQTLLAMLR